MKSKQVLLKETYRSAHRFLHVLSRPARANRDDRSGRVIYPYRGYGSRREVFLMGRVLKQKKPAAEITGDNLRSDLLGLAARIMQRGVAGVGIRASFYTDVQRVRTDKDGYFRIHMPLSQPPLDHRRWHHMELELLDGGMPAARTSGDLLVPPETARFVVVSDIDDTVVVTGVANKLKMLMRLFIQGAASRVAFPGAAALYRALHQGPSGLDHNPMLYVSRGPWGIYEILDTFFDMHDIPVGPILFLREWGISWHRPFPRRSRGHKRDLIQNMLALYGDMPFVLIGDSAQHDPEIYADLVSEHPGRIPAVYIRNVTHSNGRYHAIEALARQVADQGSTLFLAADSFAMARHMADSGLIAPTALTGILEERVQQQRGRPDIRQTRTIKGATADQTEKAVKQGRLKAAFDEESEPGGPPNIEVGKKS
jgi:phosphatidate phosphatase APP1